MAKIEAYGQQFAARCSIFCKNKKWNDESLRNRFIINTREQSRF